MYLLIDIGLHLLGHSFKGILTSGSLRCQILLKHANSCEHLLKLHK